MAAMSVASVVTRGFGAVASFPRAAAVSARAFATMTFSPWRRAAPLWGSAPPSGGAAASVARGRRATRSVIVTVTASVGFRGLESLWLLFLLVLLFTALHLIQVFLQGADASVQHLGLLQHLSLLKSGQNDVTHSLGVQKVVNELIHVHQLKLSVPVLTLHLPVVVVQRLQVFITIHRRAGQPHVHRSEQTDVFEVLILDELHDDVLLRLNLKHLQREAEEGSGLDVAAINSSDEPQLHGFVDDQLGGETETFLLPVFGLVDSGPDDFLHQVLRVGSVDTVRVFHGSVRHRRGRRNELAF